jgi:regulator of nonsense transcripts 3
VRQKSWEDAAGSWNSPSLVGLPVVEDSIFKRIPGGKRRSDARQGTIDQDPVFMQFLEDLANPTAAKDLRNDQEANEKAGKTQTTPLIEFLREKKIKAKEAAAAKNSKHSRNDSKGKAVANEDGGKKKSKESKAEKSGDAPKRTVKVMTKKAIAEAAEAAKASASTLLAAQEDSQKRDGPRGRRAGMFAVAKILQRDLGVSMAVAHRKVREAKAQADKEAAAKPGKDDEGDVSTPSTSQPSTASQNVPASPKAPTNSRGPRSKKGASGSELGKGKAAEKAADPAAPVAPQILQKKKEQGLPSGQEASAASPADAKSAVPTGPKASQPKGAQSQGGKKSSGAVVPSPGATRGFVKHANPSQGVTEPLLKAAMESFGAVTFVEIDRRKGFAYVDFAEHGSLVKAMASSPITVAQASVQVLERKDREAKKAAPATAATNGVASSSAAPNPPTGPSADKAASSAGEPKRGGRRRGGRGRGDGQPKENSKAAGHIAPAAPGPAPVASAG